MMMMKIMNILTTEEKFFFLILYGDKERGWYKIVLGAALWRWWWCWVRSLIIIIIKVLSPILFGAHSPSLSGFKPEFKITIIIIIIPLISSLKNIISLPWNPTVTNTIWITKYQSSFSQSWSLFFSSLSSSFLFLFFLHFMYHHCYSLSLSASFIFLILFISFLIFI